MVAQGEGAYYFKREVAQKRLRSLAAIVHSLDANQSSGR